MSHLERAFLASAAATGLLVWCLLCLLFPALPRALVQGFEPVIGIPFVAPYMLALSLTLYSGVAAFRFRRLPVAPLLRRATRALVAIAVLLLLVLAPTALSTIIWLLSPLAHVTYFG
jgi:hypothetical protein